MELKIIYWVSYWNDSVHKNHIAKHGSKWYNVMSCVYLSSGPSGFIQGYT